MTVTEDLMHAKFAAKLTIVFALSTICVTTFAIGLLYTRAQSAIHNEIDAKLTDVVMAASQVIDPHDLSSARRRSDHSYLRIKAALDRLRKSNQRLVHIYALVKSSEPGILKFVADSGGAATPVAPLGCPLDARNHPEILAAFEGPTTDARVRTDRWGSWLSAYAPVKNRLGYTVGIVGIDMESHYILRERDGLQITAALAFSVALALAVLLSVVFGSRISRPVWQLTAATRHIADGNLDYAISIDSNDEIGELAKSFNQMVASLKESQGRLLKRANTDGLTGLYNHRYFQERIHQELKRAVRYGRPLSLIMIDVDGFKTINDTLGHPAGDTILQKIAQTISDNVREIDIPTRYGGDEFAIILPETELKEAMQTAERIRNMYAEVSGTELNQTNSDGHGAQTPHVTLSLGVAVYPQHAKQRDSLLAAADIAMYHAKHVSQNAVCSYDAVPGAGSTMDPCRIHAFLQSASVATIAALAAAVDAKDHYTKGHSEAVAKYGVAIASQMHMSDEEQFSVRIASLLHDVGKIGMPDTILKNPGALSDEQRQIVRDHPSVGESIVKQVPQLQKILPGILYHHEKFDGTGYPCGLSADKIPLLARIICVADSFDAMTSNRPYRQGMSTDVAVAQLRASSGTQFDPQLVEIFVRWLQTEGTQARAA